MNFQAGSDQVEFDLLGNGNLNNPKVTRRPIPPPVAPEQPAAAPAAAAPAPAAPAPVAPPAAAPAPVTFTPKKARGIYEEPTQSGALVSGGAGLKSTLGA